MTPGGSIGDTAEGVESSGSTREVEDGVGMVIQELVGGGDGLGRIPEGVVFVPGVAPGDLVRVLLRRGRSFSRGTLQEVVRAGPDRRPPPCPLWDRCGGCQWQQVSYPAQLRAKEAIVARAFRQARLTMPPLHIEAAPAELGYRVRARLHFEGGEGGEGGGIRLGFRARRTHEIVDLPGCPLLVPALSELLPKLREALSEEVQGPGELLVLASPAGAVSVALQLREASSREARSPRSGARASRLDPRLAGQRAARLAARLARRLGSSVRGVTVLGPRPRLPVLGEAGTPELDLSSTGEAPYRCRPEAFMQANLAMNSKIRRRVGQLAGAGGGPVLELFAGAGNLTRDLVASGPVEAVESHGPAAELGRRNLEGQPVAWRALPAQRALDDRRGHLDPAVVVLDPPRTGARSLMAPLVDLAPARVIYVSCDPMTLARDVSLLAQGGYGLEQLHGFDTMPQTCHLELVALLARS